MPWQISGNRWLVRWVVDLKQRAPNIPLIITPATAGVHKTLEESSIPALARMTQEVFYGLLGRSLREKKSQEDSLNLDLYNSLIAIIGATP